MAHIQTNTRKVTDMTSLREQADPPATPATGETAVPTKGDYVLATKYEGGEAWDWWGLGWLDSIDNGRFMVIDSEGKQTRGNGYRRCRRISRECGNWLWAQREDLERTGAKLWDLVESFGHKHVQPATPAATTDGAASVGTTPAIVGSSYQQMDVDDLRSVRAALGKPDVGAVVPPQPTKDEVNESIQEMVKGMVEQHGGGSAVVHVNGPDHPPHPWETYDAGDDDAQVMIDRMHRGDLRQSDAARMANYIAALRAQLAHERAARAAAAEAELRTLPLVCKEWEKQRDAAIARAEAADAKLAEVESAAHDICDTLRASRDYSEMADGVSGKLPLSERIAQAKVMAEEMDRVNDSYKDMYDAKVKAMAERDAARAELAEAKARKFVVTMPLMFGEPDRGTPPDMAHGWKMYDDAIEECAKAIRAAGGEVS
jgi:hypothetical protein